MHMAEMDYTIASTGPTTEQGMPTEPGFVNGGMLSRETGPSTGPVITVDVENIDAALEKIEQLGGKTQVQARSARWASRPTSSTPKATLMGLWETAHRKAGAGRRLAAGTLVGRGVIGVGAVARQGRRIGVAPAILSRSGSGSSPSSIARSIASFAAATCALVTSGYRPRPASVWNSSRPA